jgi:hypothetical protein
MGRWQTPVQVSSSIGDDLDPSSSSIDEVNTGINKVTIPDHFETEKERDAARLTKNNDNRNFSTFRYNRINGVDHDPLPEHKAIQTPAGLLCDDEEHCRLDEMTHLLPHRGRKSRKRVLVLCTGGTLTMSHDPMRGNSLAPVQGALTKYLASMRELTEDPEMPEIIAHEYEPLIDSSDMGPGDWVS